MTLEELILKIIHTEVIQDQKTLLKHIFQQGYEIDQSTLSRIFKKHKIEKKLGKYVAISKGLNEKTHLETKIVVVPPNLVVVHTKPGFASAVSIVLEEAHIPGVAGVLAGDDTIFVAVTQQEPIEAVKKYIEDKLK